MNIKDIKKIGYEVKTSKRIKYFEKKYKLDENYNMITDKEGNPVIDEEFSEVISEFKEWCNSQESEVKKLFL